MGINPQSSDFSQLFENISPLDVNSLMPFYDVKSKTTKVFKLSSIFDDIFETFVKTNDIGTMAYQDKYDYAKISHDHDNYTSALYETSTDSQISDNMICFSIDKRDVYIKNYTQTVQHDEEAKEEYKKYQQKIGTIMFMGKNSASYEDWKLADGSTMDVSGYEYRDVLKKYYGNQTNYMITLPNLNGFFKAYPVVDNNCLRTTSGRNCVIGHAHEMDTTQDSIKIDVKEFTIQGDSEIEMRVNGMENTTYNAAHYGKYSKNTANREATLRKENYGFAINDLFTETTENRPDTVNQTYPSHNKVAAYIYIGKKGTPITT